MAGLLGWVITLIVGGHALIRTGRHSLEKLAILRLLHEKRPDLCHRPLATFDHFKDIQVPNYTPEETTKYFALYKLMEELSTFDDIRDVQIADVISMINTNKHGYPGEGPKFNVETMSPELTELFGHLHCSKSTIMGVGMSSSLGGCVAKTIGSLMTSH